MSEFENMELKDQQRIYFEGYNSQLLRRKTLRFGNTE